MNHSSSGIFCFIGFLALFDSVKAAESEVPEPFRGFDNNSEYVINYDDLTDLLQAVVLDVGLSKREITEPERATTGTRMKRKQKRFTEREANRFNFEAFSRNEAAQQYLRDIHENIQALPAKTPLANFSRDEQLAYWLNLYNVTILNELVAVYPKRSIRSMFRGKSSLLSKKLLSVAGVPLSLNDIQFRILKNNYASDPLIIYGLYQGYVGGPNIRSTAYTGRGVYLALSENAHEFINSNRGTFSNDEHDFLVAGFYKRNKAYFPQFDEALAEHLLKYLDEGNVRDRLLAASALKPEIHDWRITDLGASRHQIGGSFATNNAAMLDSFKGRRRADGGVMVAGVNVKRPKKDSDEDEIVAEDIERVPVEGARVEDVTEE